MLTKPFILASLFSALALLVAFGVVFVLQAGNARAEGTDSIAPVENKVAENLAKLKNTGDRSFAIYYTDIESPSTFRDYDVTVFDADHHPNLQSLKVRDDNKLLLGYVSLIEPASYRGHHEQLKAQGLLFSEGERQFIDIRRAEWAELVILEILPDIVKKGFDGIMIDTLDYAIDLEARHPKQYAGMIEASIRLIQAIKQHYPYLKIMINRGFRMLPRIASNIDMVLVESLLTKKLEDGTHQIKPTESYAREIALLTALQEQNPSLEVYSVDYWDMSDTAGVQKVYQTQRSLGIIPYVADPELQTLYKEPKT